MATATLHREPLLPATRPSDAERLPPFWSSLFEATADFGAAPHSEPAQPEKPSAVVGSLWIQIR